MKYNNSGNISGDQNTDNTKYSHLIQTIPNPIVEYMYSSEE